MEPYALVVFIHNTVKSYEVVHYSQVVDRFAFLSHQNVGRRADLDCRSHFASYSDDKMMVQVIGVMTHDLNQQIHDAINHLEHIRKCNW